MWYRSSSLVCVTLIAGGLLAGCTSSSTHAGNTVRPSTGPTVPAATSPSSSASTSATAAAACLSAAQAFALVEHTTGPNVALDTEHGYDCAGGWAYVNYHQLPHGNHGTKDLQQVGGQWVIANRLVGCGDQTHPPAMPPQIVAFGCGN